MKSMSIGGALVALSATLSATLSQAQSAPTPPVAAKSPIWSRARPTATILITGCATTPARTRDARLSQGRECLCRCDAGADQAAAGRGSVQARSSGASSRTMPASRCASAAIIITRGSTTGADYPIFARRKGRHGRARGGHARPAGDGQGPRLLRGRRLPRSARTTGCWLMPRTSSGGGNTAQGQGSGTGKTLDRRGRQCRGRTSPGPTTTAPFIISRRTR